MCYRIKQAKRKILLKRNCCRHIVHNIMWAIDVSKLWGISLEYFAVATWNSSNGSQANSNPFLGYYIPTYYNHMYDVRVKVY